MNIKYIVVAFKDGHKNCSVTRIKTELDLPPGCVVLSKVYDSRFEAIKFKLKLDKQITDGEIKGYHNVKIVEYKL